MGKSLKRKKKRQFCGNQFTKQATIQSKSSETAHETASVLKLGNDSFSASKLPNTATGNLIIDLDILSSIFLSVACPECFAKGLFLVEDSRYGFCTHFSLKCKSCSFVKAFASSRKTINEPEINSRFVYGMRQIGRGYSSAFKLCSTLNISPLSKTAYVNHEKKLLEVVKDVAEETMTNAAAEVSLQSVNGECGVSLDGSWQRRGYTSLNGCVTAISVDTGKVVDIEVMSAYCIVCRKLTKIKKGIEKDVLKADHVCQCNFSGASGKMETVGATRIFNRSLVKRKLKYTKYYGDGDSKGYISVRNTYGDNSVEKLECIGHIQKRVGSHLRKLKSKTKGLSGRGKLTDTFIDRLQNYYGIAVRANVGNIQNMQQNVIAVLFHCASSSNQPMHGQCPIGADSWCYYQRALAQNKKPESKSCGIQKEILKKVKPVYLELCKRELLLKCLHGKTQNANESFNGTIWRRVPKETFVSLKILKLGAYDSVIQFNSGYEGCLKVLDKLNINPGHFTLSGYRKLDRMRITDSKRHSTPASKKNRKVLKASRKKSIAVFNSKEGELYKSGAF